MWVCNNCSTNNKDEDIRCFVCDEKRPAVASVSDTSTTAELSVSASTSTTETRVSVVSEASSSGIVSDCHSTASARSSSVKKISVAIVCLIGISYLIGIIIQSLTYSLIDKVFCLSELLRASANESFDMDAYLIATGIIGAAVAVFETLVVAKLVRDERIAEPWIVSISGAILSLLLPWLALFVILLMLVVLLIVNRVTYDFYSKKSLIFSIVYAVLTVSVILTITLCAFMLPAKYEIKFVNDMSGHGVVRVIDEETGLRELREDENSDKWLDVPTKKGYVFAGYYDEIDGGGTQYFNGKMHVVRNWDKGENGTLYARWQLIGY